MAGRARGGSTSVWRWLALALAIVLLDQFTKVLIVGHYQLGDRTAVTGFFNIVRAHNTGAAFSFLAGAGDWARWLLTGIGLVATVVIVWLLRTNADQRLYALGLAGILGGAVGNVIDRLWHGHVVDFLDFHWRGWHFPAFNLADSAITLGAVCLILYEITHARRR